MFPSAFQNFVSREINGAGLSVVFRGLTLTAFPPSVLGVLHHSPFSSPVSSCQALHFLAPAAPVFLFFAPLLVSIVLLFVSSVSLAVMGLTVEESKVGRVAIRAQGE